MVWIRVALVCALVISIGAVPADRAEGASAYRWETEDGVLSYTDSRRRIPEQHRDRAERVTLSRLADSPRLTVTDGRAVSDYAKQLDERLDQLRAANRAAADAASRRQPIRETAGIRYTLPRYARRHTGWRVLRRDGRRTLAFRRDPGLRVLDSVVPSLHLRGDAGPGAEPVVVARERVRDPNHVTTRTVTVIRQGDRVLAVIEPRHPHEHRVRRWRARVD